jgi:CMP-N,N'-diacetyllegionaminic acid synthase
LNILFLITARGGSKRVPGKNLRRIGGLSLVGFKALSAKRSRHCIRLMISTDSQEIQDEAEALGVEVPFTRPAALAEDAAGSDGVVLHAMDFIEQREGRRYDAIMLLEPASPFARHKDYDEAIALYEARGASLVVGVRETEVNSLFAGPLDQDGRATRIIEKFCFRTDLRGQAMEKEYTMNGALYLIGWDHMRRTGRIYGDPERTYALPMSRLHSMEIENMLDLHFAEYLVASGAIDMKEWK